MFANIFNGQVARSQHDSASPVRPNALAEAKHAAWALSMGEVPQAPAAPRRPHRGMLPDVDMSRAVPDPNHRPLLKRLARLIGRLAGRSGAARPAARTMSGGNR
ncbi:hypothetical protein PV773_20660 [Mesorhizobium sp. CC13]|uniref:hypothetical protein n=1 Tax=Mesorhizobium sp. CC13 TaxID=3029194 RepID=UPI003263B8BE